MTISQITESEKKNYLIDASKCVWPICFFLEEVLDKHIIQNYYLM